MNIYKISFLCLNFKINKFSIVSGRRTAKYENPKELNIFTIIMLLHFVEKRDNSLVKTCPPPQDPIPGSVPPFEAHYLL